MIKQKYLWTEEDALGRLGHNPPRLIYTHAPQVKTFLDMCRELPGDVLPTGDDRIAYDDAINTIQFALDRWAGGDRNFELGVARTIGRSTKQHPITVVGSVLANCPDDPIEAAISDLPFIQDADARLDLGEDIAEAKRALDHREWKSATVVVASVVEALLLWAIDQKPAEKAQAIQDAMSKKKLSRKPDSSLDKWVLADLIPVAAELSLIEDDTEKQADLARDFRNYIHPGRVRRKGKRCDEATAHGARAAVLLVIRDLKTNFP